MNTSETNIEITRHDGILSSVCVVMPTWSKLGDDNFIEVNLPLFGLKTFAKNEDDVEKSISEVLKCFCISAEKNGNGLEKELVRIGWTALSSKEEHASLDFNPNDNIVLQQIMQTGEFSHADLEFA